MSQHCHVCQYVCTSVFVCVYAFTSIVPSYYGYIIEMSTLFKSNAVAYSDEELTSCEHLSDFCLVV